MPAEDRRVSGSLSVESDSGSPQRVAKELWHTIARQEDILGPKGNRKVLLDLYAECLHATKGYRDFS